MDWNETLAFNYLQAPEQLYLLISGWKQNEKVTEKWRNGSSLQTNEYNNTHPIILFSVR